MLYIQEDQRVAVWSIEDKGSYSLVQMSSSRKDKRNDEWVNSSWGFVRFVGKAHEKAADLERGDRIVLKGAGISREPYMKDDQKEWPKNPQIVVFNFKKVGSTNSSSDDDDTSSEETVEYNEEDLPF